MGVADRTPERPEQLIRDEPTRKAIPMSGGYYHTPAKPISSRVRCPVCQQEVYSRAGIHPQCAVRQSDPPRPKKQAVIITDPVGERT